MSGRLKRALHFIAHHERQLARVLVEDFPVGRQVDWFKGRYRQRGVVTGHRHFAVVARNEKNGRVVRVPCDQLLEARG